MDGEILKILDSLEKETGLDREVLINTVESAVLTAAKKKFGEGKAISVSLEGKTGEIKIVIDNKVISLEKLGRVAAQNARQIIFADIRKQVSKRAHDRYRSQIGEVLTGQIEALKGEGFIIDLGDAEGFLPRKECLPQDSFRIGDRVKAYLLELRKEGTYSSLLLSRTHPNFLKRLLEIEVPEIKEGVIEIRSVVREPGNRAKVAVESHMENVDSVGACVGLKGARIHSVVAELKGEKIDIIPYDEDIKVFIGRSLAPAEISTIQVFPEDKRARIIVDDDKLSLAIGKKGVNVRLAARLTGWKLDIRSKTQAEEESKLTPIEIEKKLREIPGVGASTAHQLGKSGFITIDDVARAKVEDLLFLPGLGKEKVRRIIQSAREIIKKEEDKSL